MILDDIVARARVDDVGAAAAVDRVRAGAPRENIHGRGAGDRGAQRERGGVHVLEIDDDGVVAAGLIGGVGEVDGRGRLQGERVVSASAVDRDFRAMVGDDVVARARVDDVGAAVAVDGVGARARRDDTRAGGTGDREGGGQRGGVQILEIED